MNFDTSQTRLAFAGEPNNHQLLLPPSARMSVGNFKEMMASAIALRLVIDQFYSSDRSKTDADFWKNDRYWRSGASAKNAGRGAKTRWVN
ncbi:MAG: hypothetical protein RO009_13095 [Pseudorhodoplanes sp.]|nr:hypothetical protein [Pseudorhodoplanes sp.]